MQAPHVSIDIGQTDVEHESPSASQDVEDSNAVMSDSTLTAAVVETEGGRPTPTPAAGMRGRGGSGWPVVRSVLFESVGLIPVIGSTTHAIAHFHNGDNVAGVIELGVILTLRIYEYRLRHCDMLLG